MTVRRSVSRIFDGIAIAAVVFTMSATTPLGGWLVEHARRALGYPQQQPGLARWFKTGLPTPATGIAIRPEILAAPPEAGTPESLTAARVGLRPSLARGVSVMAAGGRADAQGHLEVVLMRAMDPALASVELVRPGPESGGEAAASVLIEAVARLSRQLGGEAPALAALVVGPEPVREALARARALAVAAPESWDGFGRYLGADERRAAAPFVRGALALAAAYELRPPLAAPARVSSGFGPRTHPVLGTRRMHTGVDLAVPTGTALLAVGAGKVVHAGHDSVNGNFVRLDHGHGLTSAYCHASELSVSKHEVVEARAVIGKSGNTGRSTGPHLHFQLELDGTPVDPALFLGARLSGF